MKPVPSGSSPWSARSWTIQLTGARTVTVKLTDVDRVRRLATQAHPEDAALIADSLAVAWQRAADPFAPLRSIPGIAWRPVKVDVEHLPARTAAGIR